jgi:excinuclease ABC subunit C
MARSLELQEKLKSLPTNPGCYLYKDASGTVIYVGKAINLRNRVRSYFQSPTGLTLKTRRLVERIVDLDTVVTESELEALILECNLIKEHRPYFNVRLRDDKQYPYMLLTMSEPFPRLVTTRRVHRNDGNRYFGPYTSSKAMWESIRLIYRLFPLVTCRKQWDNTPVQRPCLYYHMGRCPHAPCAGLADQKSYRQAAEDVALFLEGRQEVVLQNLRHEMIAASEALDYERAARNRDQIAAVETVIERQRVLSVKGKDQDVVAVVENEGQAAVQLFFIRNGKLIGQEHFVLDGALDESDMEEATSDFIKQYYQDATYVPHEIILPRHLDETAIIEQWLKQKKGTRVVLTVPERGEKKSLLDMADQNARLALDQMRKRSASELDRLMTALGELQLALKLKELPDRIEAYDISTIQGRYSVGGMVVFERGKPVKSDFRRFRIKLPEAVGEPNDFAMMREVIRRRLSEASANNPKFSRLPDLMLIDGGKGQLSSALEAARDAGYGGLAMVGLAKQFELIYLPGAGEPVVLSGKSPALFLLQRIRDEVHRYAITYHRTVRGRDLLVSALDDVPGVGAVRKKALIRHFGSVEGVKLASRDDIAAVPSMNAKAAAAVYNSFHPQDATSVISM